MKISKSLLSAIAAGIVISVPTSCDTTQARSEVNSDLPLAMVIPMSGDTIPPRKLNSNLPPRITYPKPDTAQVIEVKHGSNHHKNCPATCTFDHSIKSSEKKRTWSCAACGMG